MGRNSENVLSSISIKFNNVMNDPFIEGSKTEAWGKAIHKVVYGVLGLTTNSNVEEYYSKRTQQVVFKVNYFTHHGAAKAQLLASFINGADIEIEQSEQEAETETEAPVKAAKATKAAKTDTVKRGRGRPKKGYTKNGKKLGRPVGSKNAKADTTETVAAPVAVVSNDQPQSLAIDMNTLVSAMQAFLSTNNAPAALPVAETAPVTENATVTA